MVHRNTLLSLEQFLTLCQLQHGIVLAKLDARAGITFSIDSRLQEIDDFEDEVAEMKFKNDGPKSRAAMIATLEADRFALGALRQSINDFDQAECRLLLEKVEEVYARAAQTNAADLYQISQEVYGQGIQHGNG